MVDVFPIGQHKLGELRRAAQLNNEVLRDLVLSVDDRLVDTLVSHARGSGKPAETPKTAAVAEKSAEKPAEKSVEKPAEKSVENLWKRKDEAEATKADSGGEAAS